MVRVTIIEEFSRGVALQHESVAKTPCSCRSASDFCTLEELLALSDKGIQQALFPASSIPSTRKPPDYERVHRELAKNGVTLSLLWNEYCEECYASKELPLMYTQFCLHYREYAQQTKATGNISSGMVNVFSLGQRRWGPTPRP